MAIRRYDGSVEAWRDLQYRPPLRMTVVAAIMAQAQSWRAGDPIPPPTLVPVPVIEVWCGPGADLPKPETPREYRWRVEDEWLGAEMRLATEE